MALRSSVLAVLVAVFAGLPSTAGAALKPENPVGPVAYHGWRYDPAVTFAAGTEPQTKAAAYDGPPLGLRFTYVGRKAAEPTMGVDKEGRAFYAASDFDGAGGAAARTEVYRSTDGGVSFKEVTPGAGGQDLPPSTLDPYVYVDQITGRVFSIDLFGAGSFLAFSDDGGDTWDASAMSAPGVNDHQTFFSGPPPKGNPLIGPPLLRAATVAYYCVNALTEVSCSYSQDGGETFQETAAPPLVGCVGCQTGHGVVDKDGRVFLPRGGIPGLEPFDSAVPTVYISDNGGLSWDTVAVTPKPLTSARHTAVAVDKAGNVYYAWYDADHKLPYLAISKDHGQTWGKPIMVAPPGVYDTNFPMVAAGDPGHVAVSFPGSSVNDPADETRPWHAWVTVSTNALDADPLFVAAPANDPRDPIHRGTCDNRCAGMFDFLDLQVSPKDGTLFATFTDTCTPGNKCSSDRKTDLATDAQGVAVSQVSGPRLVGPPLGAAPARAVAATQALAAPSPPPPPPSAAIPSQPRPVDHVRPRVTLLRVSALRRRTPRLDWQLTEPGSVTIALRRGRKVVARMQSGRPSPSGRISLGRLKRGTYRLTLVGVDRAGNRSGAETITVRVR